MRGLGAVILVALLVRGTVCVMFWENLDADPDAYRQLATRLVETGTYGLQPDRPTAFRPPLYPLLLAPLIAVSPDARLAIALFHVLLGTATAAAAVQLGRLARLGRASIGAGLLVACDPLLMHQATLVMTETLAALLSVLLVIALHRTVESHRLTVAFGTGLVVGLAILCRPTYLAGLPLVLAALVFYASKPPDRWAKPALVLLGTVLALAPWILRNAIQLGAPIATTTHGGYTLWLANNPSYYAYLKRPGPKLPWAASELDDEQRAMFRAAGGREPVADKAATQAALTAIRQQPRMFVYSSLVRVGQFWSPLPNALTLDESPARRAARYAVAVWYVALYAAVAIGVVRRRRELLKSPWLWSLVLVATFMGVHTFYWSNLRMRAPLMPLVAVLAAGAAGSPRHRNKSL